jgi:hypothetical protein
MGSASPNYMHNARTQSAVQVARDETSKSRDSCVLVLTGEFRHFGVTGDCDSHVLSKTHE